MASRSLRYAAGINLGTAAVVLLIATGVTAVFLGLPGMKTAVTVLAAAYMLYLTWHIATAPPVAADEGRSTVSFVSRRVRSCDRQSEGLCGDRRRLCRQSDRTRAAACGDCQDSGFGLRRDRREYHLARLRRCHRRHTARSEEGAHRQPYLRRSPVGLCRRGIHQIELRS
jgi:hypothetical protein